MTAPLVQTQPTLKYGKMILSVETVTPAIAQKWLERNTGNRRLRSTVVNQYAHDMNNNDWKEKPSAICFDVDGNLGNGQHSLLGVVNSGKTQRFLVATNVTREAIAKMDVGAKRTIADVAHFLGAEMRSRTAAVARAIAWGVSDSQVRSFDEVYEQFLVHQEAIEAICSLAPKQAGLNATLIAVCCRAWYQKDYRPKIARFIQVLKTGVSEGTNESAAIRLRDTILSNPGSGSVRKDRLLEYQKIESALSYFIKGKPMGKIYGSDKELFPLPKEKVA